jgi:hypothetical protein
LIGVLAGLAVGVIIGWQLYPVEYTNSPLSDLAGSYQEEYTVMISEGYQHDGDAQSALDRLRLLGKDNIIEYVRALTERYISQSKVQAIEPMVALTEALVGPDNLPPIMRLYRSTPAPTPANQ